MIEAPSFDRIPPSAVPNKEVTAMYRSLQDPESSLCNENHDEDPIFSTTSRSSTDATSTTSDGNNVAMNTGKYPPSTSLIQPARLQTESVLEKKEKVEYQPIYTDDPASYDLTVPYSETNTRKERYNLTERSLFLFSREHLQVILNNDQFLPSFVQFVRTYRTESVPLLDRYLDLLKALKALQLANAIIEDICARSFAHDPNGIPKAAHAAILDRVNEAFDLLVREELPAFITYRYIEIASATITAKITGKLSPQLRSSSAGLAEVFCLTDPSRADNPIMFTSEEFHRTTQYGLDYVLGRNCRFLQGTHTNPSSITRLREAIKDGRQHQEVFLNYRRDGSPFVNLLMLAPLRDARGTLRYFLGAQVDVSALVEDCTGFDSLSRLLYTREHNEEVYDMHNPAFSQQDGLEGLSKLLTQEDISTILLHGGKMLCGSDPERAEYVAAGVTGSERSRLIIREHETFQQVQPLALGSSQSLKNLIPSGDAAGNDEIKGRLLGIYQNYLLVRPYPSLRILFASPSQHFPGILQSHFMNKIGGTDHTKNQIVAAFAHGRPITAKVRWVTKLNGGSRNKWIHCTPLLGIGNSIGVWIVIIVDEDEDRTGHSQEVDDFTTRATRRMAPPITDPEGNLTAHGRQDSNVTPFETQGEPSNEYLSRHVLQNKSNHTNSVQNRHQVESQGIADKDIPKIRWNVPRHVANDLLRSSSGWKSRIGKRGTSPFVALDPASRESSVRSFEI